MPPKTKAKTEDLTPKGMKPFLFHGVQLQERPGVEQAVAECPFCGKDKFFVNPDNGMYDCKVCAQKGNAFTFLRALWEMSEKHATDEQALVELAADRGLLSIGTLSEWGVVKSMITGEWLLPAQGADNKLHQLYRYVRLNGGMRLLATPRTVVDGEGEIRHGLHGVNLFDKAKATVYVCEGPWDGMTLWETLRYAKREAPTGHEAFSYTSNPGISALGEANVVAVPGSNVFRPEWLPLFAGKKVVLLYDNDHPKPHPRTGQPVPPAGLEGMKRAAVALASSTEYAPGSIHYLCWGNEQDPIDRELPSGTDLRDVIGAGGDSMGDRVRMLAGLLDKVRPIPNDWLEGRSPTTAKKGGLELEALPCESWKMLQTSWRKSMKWTEGLDRALSVMLASVASTMSGGDQLWAKIIGPASCGKSTLCEAISANRKHVRAISCLRGFHSGYKEGRGAADKEEDNSLIAQLRDKTLITKDGDTLLQAPNLGQILAEARDIYDRTSRTHYRNNMGKDYEGINMTWLLCGTASLRRLDKSELGERFVDCVVMEGVDDEQEDEILDRVFAKADKSAGIQLNGTAMTQDSPETIDTKRLTAGYVNYLRDNGVALAEQITWPEEHQRLVKAYAKFTSFIRARPSVDQHEIAERELAARLLSQFVRLAKYLAVVLNRTEVDAEVMERVRRVTLDTARGTTLKVAHSLKSAGDNGAEIKAVCIQTGLPTEQVHKLLRFLNAIGAAEPFFTTVVRGITSKVRWRLTDRMSRLYDATINPMK